MTKAELMSVDIKPCPFCSAESTGGSLYGAGNITDKPFRSIRHEEGCWIGRRGWTAITIGVDEGDWNHRVPTTTNTNKEKL